MSNLKKSYLKSGIKYYLILLLALCFVSCTSLKDYDAGEQPETYVTEYEEVPYVNDTEPEPFEEIITTLKITDPEFNVEYEESDVSIVEDGVYINNRTLNEISNQIKNLEEEVNYYRNQITEVPKTEYIIIDSQTGNVITSPEELIYNNKQDSRVTANSNSQFFNSITTYIFNEGNIYDIYFTPANVTDIRLEAGESVINIILGNPNAWICEQITASENDMNYVHVFIRPLNTNMQSDCVIATNKRMYYLRLISTVSVAQMGVRWYYPYSSTSLYSEQNVVSNLVNSYATSNSSQTAVDFSKHVSDLNFNYKISGVASWKPVRAYSDTERTYIQFKNEFVTNSETPVIYLKQGNEESLVNFTIKGITYIVPLILSSNESFILRVEDKTVIISQDI